MEHDRKKTKANGGGGVLQTPTTFHNQVKLMCSYGGKIQLRPDADKLIYVGGDTKLLTVDRNINFSDIVKKLRSLVKFKSEDVCMKYQLPGEDLDVLVSLINHDDLENMMVEYDNLHRFISPSNKPVRMRLFLSSRKKPSSEVPSNAPGNPDYLFGFDKEYHSNYNRQPSNPTKSEFDLELWKIPSNSNFNRKGNKAEKAKTRGGHVTGAAAKQQLGFRFPAMSVGLQPPGCVECKEC